MYWSFYFKILPQRHCPADIDDAFMHLAVLVTTVPIFIILYFVGSAIVAIVNVLCDCAMHPGPAILF